MAGSIIASSIGFALAGFILSEAIRNSRRQVRSKKAYEPWLVSDDSFRVSTLRDSVRRGYDTPELHREDTLARMPSGNSRDAG
ncbi:MAG: hypothetical protein ACREP3_06900 [Candidatus Binatia bacterium]